MKYLGTVGELVNELEYAKGYYKKQLEELNKETDRKLTVIKGMMLSMLALVFIIIEEVKGEGMDWKLYMVALIGVAIATSGLLNELRHRVTSEGRDSVTVTKLTFIGVEEYDLGEIEGVIEHYTSECEKYKKVNEEYNEVGVYEVNGTYEFKGEVPDGMRLMPYVFSNKGEEFRLAYGDKGLKVL